MQNLPRNQNALLRSMPDSDWERLLPDIELIHLPSGTILSDTNIKSKYVYFPSTAVASILHELENGASSEVAIVGNDGILGLSIFMADGISASKIVVKSAGYAYRINSHNVLQVFKNSWPLMSLLLRFSLAVIAQITLTAACNRHHLLERQLSRFLLTYLDRVNGSELFMTQDLIAKSLGVRREGVTEAAIKIQNDGLIQYSRGNIHILDRNGLQRRSCECYQAVKSEYAKLLPELKR